MRRWVDRAREWNLPVGWTKLLAIDAHTAGDPLRVVVEGFPHLDGDPLAEGFFLR